MHGSQTFVAIGMIAAWTVAINAQSVMSAKCQKQTLVRRRLLSKDHPLCTMVCSAGQPQMIDDYEISLATPYDIPGILALQEPNLVERGGGLSVRQTADWFGHAILKNRLSSVGATIKSSVMC